MHGRGTVHRPTSFKRSVKPETEFDHAEPGRKETVPRRSEFGLDHVTDDPIARQDRFAGGQDGCQVGDTDLLEASKPAQATEPVVAVDAEIVHLVADEKAHAKRKEMTEFDRHGAF